MFYSFCTVFSARILIQQREMSVIEYCIQSQTFSSTVLLLLQHSFISQKIPCWFVCELFSKLLMLFGKQKGPLKNFARQSCSKFLRYKNNPKVLLGIHMHPKKQIIATTQVKREFLAMTSSRGFDFQELARRDAPVPGNENLLMMPSPETLLFFR